VLNDIDCLCEQRALGSKKFETANCSLFTAYYLKERVDEGCHGGTRCENYEATQQNKADDDWQEPEFLPLFHKRPKL